MVVPSIVVPIPKHAAPGACVYISTTAGEFLFNLPARSAGRSVKVMLPKPSGATKPPRLSCAWLGDEVIAPRRDAGTLRSPLAVLEGYLAERLAEHGVAGNLPVAQARAAPPPKRCCVPGLSRCLWGGRAAAQHPANLVALVDDRFGHAVVKPYVAMRQLSQQLLVSTILEHLASASVAEPRGLIRRTIAMDAWASLLRLLGEDLQRA